MVNDDTLEKIGRFLVYGLSGFTEADHPRAKDGKFTDSGGGEESDVAGGGAASDAGGISTDDAGMDAVKRTPDVAREYPKGSAASGRYAFTVVDPSGVEIAHTNEFGHALKVAGIKANGPEPKMMRVRDNKGEDGDKDGYVSRTYPKSDSDFQTKADTLRKRADEAGHTPRPDPNDIDDGFPGWLSITDADLERAGRYIGSAPKREDA